MHESGDPTGQKRESGDVGTSEVCPTEVTVHAATQQRGWLARRFIGSKVPVDPLVIDATPSVTCNNSNGRSGRIEYANTNLDSSSPPKSGSPEQANSPGRRPLSDGAMSWLSRLRLSTTANLSPKLIRGSSAASATSHDDCRKPRCNDSPFISFRSFQRVESSPATSRPALAPHFRVPPSLSTKPNETPEGLRCGTSTRRPPPPTPLAETSPTDCGQDSSSAGPPLVRSEMQMQQVQSLITSQVKTVARTSGVDVPSLSLDKVQSLHLWARTGVHTEPNTEPSQELQLSPIEEQASQHASSQEPGESGSGGSGHSSLPGKSSPKASDAEGFGGIGRGRSAHPCVSGRSSRCPTALDNAGLRAEKGSVRPLKGGRNARTSRDISPLRNLQPAQSTPRPATRKESKHTSKPKRSNVPAHM